MSGDREIFFVESRCKELVGDAHADAIREALPERASRYFNTWREAALRMSRGLASPLTKLLEIIERNIIACEMQHAVEQHRRMAVAQDEAVAVEPVRVFR